MLKEAVIIPQSLKFSVWSGGKIQANKTDCEHARAKHNKRKTLVNVLH